MMKMEILIHELLHMFGKQVLILSGFCLKKFSESFSQDTRDLFPTVVTSRPSFDSSVEHSSRPSFASTSTIGYDGLGGEGSSDGSDTRNDGGDNAD